jgi:hypothetical protein
MPVFPRLRPRFLIATRALLQPVGGRLLGRCDSLVWHSVDVADGGVLVDAHPLRELPVADRSGERRSALLVVEVGRVTSAHKGFGLWTGSTGCVVA